MLKVSSLFFQKNDVMEPMNLDFLDGFEKRLRVDLDLFRQKHNQLGTAIIQNQLLLNDKAGFSVNINKVAHLQQIFADQPVIKYNLKRRTPSFSKDVIKRFESPFSSLILKLKTLYAEERYYQYLSKALDGEYFAFSFRQEPLIGRIYAKDPPVMSFPLSLRECIVPEKNAKFLYIDFKSLHLCIIAYLLGDSSFISDVKQGKDVFQSISFSLSCEREDVKTTLYAFFYEADPLSLSKRLFGNDHSVYKILDVFFDQYPVMRGWQQVKEECRRSGFSETLLYKRRYTINRSEPDYEREVRRAINFITAGTEAEVLRELLKALLRLSYSVRIFVHDAVLVEADVDHLPETQQGLYNIASSFFQNSLPFCIRVGDNWAQVCDRRMDDSLKVLA